MRAVCLRSHTRMRGIVLLRDEVSRDPLLVGTVTYALKRDHDHEVYLRKVRGASHRITTDTVAYDSSGPSSAPLEVVGKACGENMFLSAAECPQVQVKCRRSSRD